VVIGSQLANQQAPARCCLLMEVDREVSGAQSTGAIDDALACDDLTIALGLLRSCLASVKP
jgi:hypothetical protein